MLQMSELKPCPFCGSRNHLLFNNGFMAFVVCNNCGSSSRISLRENNPIYKESVIEAWNRRVADEETRPLVDAVEVVRCKDCARREVCRTSTVWAVAPNDNWFCADGERK